MDAAEVTEELTKSLAAGSLHEESVAAGRLAGRVEVLLWAQSELQVELAALLRTDRFADTRGLENFLMRVRDSLARVQDGTGAWGGLVRSALAGSGADQDGSDPVPSTEMGG